MKIALLVVALPVLIAAIVLAALIVFFIWYQ